MVFRLGLVAICWLCIMGCSNQHSISQLRAQVAKDMTMAQETQGFEERRIHTGTFNLFALLRPAQSHTETLHVYIEGDGFAWKNRYTPSTDPTPTKATALDMARHDPHAHKAAVLYLARPCQYMKPGEARLCKQKYWTSHRFAPEVITAMNEAVNIIKAEVGAQKVVLVGYSGGGTVAALLAAKRHDYHDVLFFGSVAGNLDTDSWTTWHKISPLKGSLNPAQHMAPIAALPQKHISSYDDAIVPPAVTEKYCKKLKTAWCERIHGMEHGGNWYTVWDYIYK